MKNHPMNRMTRTATVFAGLFLCCIAPDVSAEELKPICHLTFDALTDSGELAEESAKDLGAEFMFTKTKTAIENSKRIKPGMVKNALACGIIGKQFGNFLSLKNPPALPETFTICFWFRYEKSQFMTCLLNYKGGWSWEPGFAIRIYGNYLAVNQNPPKVPGNGIYCAKATDIQMNTWYFMAVSWDSKAWKIYMNGKLSEPVKDLPEYGLKMPKPGTPMNIGGYTDNPGNNNVFQGAIDEFRIYKGALTAEQITEIMSKDLDLANEQAKELTYAK
jgi:hypothetical protein